MNRKLLGNLVRCAKNNFHQSDLSVKDICSSIGCSKNYLHEILIREDGISVMHCCEYFRNIFCLVACGEIIMCIGL